MDLEPLTLHVPSQFFAADDVHTLKPLIEALMRRGMGLKQELEFRADQMGVTHILLPPRARNRDAYSMCTSYALTTEPHALWVDIEDLRAWVEGRDHPLGLTMSIPSLPFAPAPPAAPAPHLVPVAQASGPLPSPPILAPRPIPYRPPSGSLGEMLTPRAPKKSLAGRRTPKKTPKSKGSSHSRPPSRAGSDVESSMKAARTLRKAKSLALDDSKPAENTGSNDMLLALLLEFARQLSPGQYALMKTGHDFRTSFWNAFVRAFPEAQTLPGAMGALQRHRSSLEAASRHFAAGYQLPKEKDLEVLAAFEEYLPTYPWEDMVVRKGDVQRAFERSDLGRPFAVLFKRTPSGGINPYWTHFFKRFAPRWEETYPRLLQTETLHNVEKSPRKRRTSAPTSKHGRQPSLPQLERLAVSQNAAAPGPLPGSVPVLADFGAPPAGEATSVVFTSPPRWEPTPILTSRWPPEPAPGPSSARSSFDPPAVFLPAVRTPNTALSALPSVPFPSMVDTPFRPQGVALPPQPPLHPEAQDSTIGQIPQYLDQNPGPVPSLPGAAPPDHPPAILDWSGFGFTDRLEAQVREADAWPVSEPQPVSYVAPAQEQLVMPCPAPAEDWLPMGTAAPPHHQLDAVGPAPVGQQQLWSAPLPLLAMSVQGGPTGPWSPGTTPHPGNAPYAPVNGQRSTVGPNVLWHHDTASLAAATQQQTGTARNATGSQGHPGTSYSAPPPQWLGMVNITPDQNLQGQQTWGPSTPPAPTILQTQFNALWPEQQAPHSDGGPSSPAPAVPGPLADTELDLEAFHTSFANYNGQTPTSPSHFDDAFGDGDWLAQQFGHDGDDVRY